MKKYRDVLIEQFVRETRPGIVMLPRFLAYIAVVTLTMMTALLTFYLLTEYFFVATIFVLILSFLISTPFRKKKYIEYEYSFLDGEFKISKILNKMKRKPLFSFTCQDIQQMSRKYDLNRGKSSNNFNQIIDVSSADDAPERWYLIVSGSTGGRTLLIIEPNEKLQGALREYIPRSVADV